MWSLLSLALSISLAISLSLILHRVGQNDQLINPPIHSDCVHILLPLCRNSTICCTNHNVHVLCSDVQNTWRLQMDRFVSQCCVAGRWMFGKRFPSASNRIHGGRWYSDNSEDVVEGIEIGKERVDIRGHLDHLDRAKLISNFCVCMCTGVHNGSVPRFVRFCNVVELFCVVCCIIAGNGVPVVLLESLNIGHCYSLPGS